MRVIFTIFIVLSTFLSSLSQEVNREIWDNYQEIFQERDTIPVLLPDQHNIHQDSRLRNMLLGHIKNNKAANGIEGFRIEIFFSSAMNAKDEAFQLKKKFMTEFPDLDVHIKYITPNFRVRIGDFRTRSEALKIHSQIKELYPGAFIVPDIIRFPEIKQNRSDKR